MSFSFKFLIVLCAFLGDIYIMVCEIQRLLKLEVYAKEEG